MREPCPPSSMRAGVIQVPDNSGRWTPYNLNPRPVTVDGVTYQPAMCGTSNCDPRGIGLNPILSQIWEKYMPLPNNPDGGDQYNTQGFRSQIRMPVKSNFLVARIDRDLHPKHRLMLSYRYFHLYQSTTSQVDIGGFFPGNTLGEPKSLTDRPQTPSFYVAGLTSVLTPRLINDFRVQLHAQFMGVGFRRCARRNCRDSAPLSSSDCCLTRPLAATRCHATGTVMITSFAMT